MFVSIGNMTQNFWLFSHILICEIVLTAAQLIANGGRCFNIWGASVPFANWLLLGRLQSEMSRIVEKFENNLSIEQELKNNSKEKD